MKFETTFSMMVLIVFFKFCLFRESAVPRNSSLAVYPKTSVYGAQKPFVFCI
jgi:hypothetical protein